mmetsp:Transcript_5235/g.8276  ORF Transcript_5235/g.8276 Transcript_5235/m.8276 type:complete len:80 (+) Transcript_5235:109-348(+)
MKRIDGSPCLGCLMPVYHKRPMSPFPFVPSSPVLTIYRPDQPYHLRPDMNNTSTSPPKIGTSALRFMALLGSIWFLFVR